MSFCLSMEPNPVAFMLFQGLGMSDNPNYEDNHALIFLPAVVVFQALGTL
jgi:hypothetical protein